MHIKSLEHVAVKFIRCLEISVASRIVFLCEILHGQIHKFIDLIKTQWLKSAFNIFLE